MILVQRHNNFSGAFRIKVYSKEELKDDMQIFINGIMKDPEVLLIFLEEFNNRIPEIEERINDVQNSFSDSDREQDN